MFYKDQLINNKLNEMTAKLEVIKRNGKREKVSPTKIFERIETMCKKLNLKRVDVNKIAEETVLGLYDGVTTEELDYFAADKCADKIIDDPEYDKLAAGLCVSNLHKTTPYDFLEVTKKLYRNKDIKGRYNPLVFDKYRLVVKKNIDKIRNAINYENDYLFDFFGLKTLERSYLLRIKNYKNIKLEKDLEKDLDLDQELEQELEDQDQEDQEEQDKTNKEIEMIKNNGRIVERPQQMLMRVSIGIHLDDIDSAIETYKLMSEKWFTHASPTLFNSGTMYPQMSSCFLANMDDSLEGICETIKDVAYISKRAGGIGITLSNIRAQGSLIRSTNGISDGIIPLIKLLNAEARYINQGGRRKGSFAVYLEPWHSDIYNFCELRRNVGDEELRARDIFLALWVCDLFMERALKEKWSLMCPDECPGLTTTYGEEFNKLYLKYENAGMYKRQVNAYDLMTHIMKCQFESGMPYMLYKDNINKKSNQKNIGTIQCSNLCAEIVQYTSNDEIAVCNLASVCLPKYVINNNNNISYDFKKLHQVTKIVTKNLNKIIDINYYTSKKTKTSNLKHRPIGIGVQGLADVYAMCSMPFDSKEARELNKKIFETIYHASLEASMELAKKDGPYETFKGSPFSEGKLQWHLWGLTKNELILKDLDWDSLIENIKKFGVRNSLLTTVMPTASTGQIMGNNEACEPFTSNLLNRTTLAGEYIVVNNHLIETLIKENLWTKEIKEELIYDKGSIQNIEEIPDRLKQIYLTAYEMKSKPFLQQAVERGPFIDQSQSQNMFCNFPNTEQLYNYHMYGWKMGLKAGMYYLRSRPSTEALNFGLDYEAELRIIAKREAKNKFKPKLDAIIEDEKVVDVKVVEEDIDVEEDVDDEEIAEQERNMRARSKFAACETCSG